MCSEKLLPIVAGCEALIIGDKYAGNSVLVKEVFTREYLQQHRFTQDAEHLIGHWVCLWRVDAFLKLQVLVIPERLLMRIDGHRPQDDVEDFRMLISPRFTYGRKP